MKWAHLPLDGGIYAQHPQLIDEWMMLFQMDNEHQKMEHDKSMAEAKAKSRGR